MSYTKGPYKIIGPSVGAWDKSGDYAATVPGQNGHDPYIIAEFFRTVDHGVEMPAFENANLFAASPDMLEALEAIVGYVGQYEPYRIDSDFEPALQLVRQAITKTKGEQA